MTIHKLGIVFAFAFAMACQQATAVTIAPSGAEVGKWTADWAAARALAKTTNNYYIVCVSKTIGCAYCAAATGLIWDTADFSAWAVSNNIVLVYANAVDLNSEPVATVLRTYSGITDLPVVLLLDSAGDGKRLIGRFVVREVAWGAGALTPKNFIKKVATYFPKTDDAYDPADNTITGATLLTPAPANQAHGPHSMANADVNDWFKLPLSSGTQYRFSLTNAKAVNATPTVEFYSDYIAATNGVAWTNIPLLTLTAPLTFVAAETGTNYIRFTRPTATSADVTYTLNYRVFEDCTVGFAVTNVTQSEDAASVAVTVTRAGRLTDAVTVSYASSNVTATAGQDYTTVSGSLTFGVGETTKTITIPLIYSPAAPDFGNERFDLHLTATSEVLVDPAACTVVLLDADKTADDHDPADDVIRGAVRLEMAVTNRVAGERYLSAADTNDWFVFTNVQSGKQYRVSVTQFMARNASPSVDFFYTNTTSGGFSAALPPTRTLASLTNAFVFTPDSASVSHGLWMRVSRPAAADAAVRYTLNYREWLSPEFGFAPTNMVVPDTSRSVTLTVRRSVNTEVEASVAYQTANDSALAGKDYTAAAGTLLFGQGETEKTFSVQILDDGGIWRGDRAFHVDLQPAADLALGAARCWVLITETNAPATDARDSRAGGDATSDVATALEMARTNRTVSGVLSAEDTSDWFVFTNIQTGGEYRVAISNLKAVNATNLTAAFYVTGQAGLTNQVPWLTNFVDVAALTNFFFTVPASLPSWDGKVWLHLSRDPGERVHVGYTLNYREWVPCEISFVTDAVTVSEAASEVRLSVRRTIIAEIATSATLTLRNGTATAGDDYVATTVTLAWLPSDPDIKTVRIPLMNYDTRWEGDETFFADLTPDPSSAMVGEYATTAVTIIEKDPPVKGQLSFLGYGPATNAFASATKIPAKEGDTLVYWLTRTDGKEGAAVAQLMWTDGTNKIVAGQAAWTSLEDGAKAVAVTVPQRPGYQAVRAVTLVFTATGATVVKGKETSTLSVTDSAVEQTLVSYASDRSHVPFSSALGAWFVTSGAAVRCVPPVKGGTSIMQATVTGPGTLRYFAETFGAAGCTFTVKVGSGAAQAVTPGITNELAVTGSGSKAITWVFTRGTTSLDADAYAQISGIEWIPDAACETRGAFNGYAWLVTETEAGSITNYGLASLTVAASGRISGTLRFSTKAYTFTAPGYAPGGPVAEGVVARSGAEQVLVRIETDPATGVATLSNEDESLSAVLSRNGWGDKPLSAARAAVLEACVGYYTMVLPDADTTDEDSFGSGYLSLTVSSSGSIKVAGKLADGTAVSLSSVLLLDEAGAPYTVLYAAPSSYAGGYLFATVAFTENGANLTVLDGLGMWSKNNTRSMRTTRFERSLSLIGGYYSKAETLMAYYYAGDDLTTDPKILFNKATGLFTGNFRYYYSTVTPTRYATLPYQGLLVPSRADAADGLGEGIHGRGYFLYNGDSFDFNVGE